MLQWMFTSRQLIDVRSRLLLPCSQGRSCHAAAVLEAFGIDKAVFVGHSVAGAELSALGQAYSARVNKLVYLDAADLAERFLPSRREPPLPVYTDADLKSLWAFQAASARLQALRQPDPSVCLRVKFDANGAIVDDTTPDSIAEKFAQGPSALPPTNWASIKAPRLGIFALFTIEARQPWYWYLTAAEQAAFDEAWPPIVAWHEETIGKFADHNPIPPLILPGAPHYVYLNHETDIVRAMRQFFGLPVGGH